MTVARVQAYAGQVGDALWRIESARLPRVSAPAGVAVCGPSGGAGGLAALAGAHAHDGLAPWAGPGTFVLCASYSGDDVDALDGFARADALGAPRAVVCTAGQLAERAREEGVPVIGVPGGLGSGEAAIVYFVLAAVACSGGLVRAEAEAGGERLQRLGKEWEPDASAIAERLRGRVPVFVGPLALARRWASSWEAATGAPAYWREGESSVPEPPAPPGPAARPGVAAPLEFVTIDPPGETPLERVLAGVFQGDLVAAYAGGGSPAAA